MSVLIVGSVALDSVITPIEMHEDLLGGSASFAAISASFFSPVNLVGVIGDDFPKDYITYFGSRNVDLTGLQIVAGETMRWTGEYEWDLNVRHTRHIALNVFEHFTPAIPEQYKKPKITLLANIAPGLQSHVLDQVPEPRFVIADTMDLWINIAATDLHNLLKRIDLLVLNDSEARLLTKDASLIRAARKIQSLGPKYVAIKKGEHGCLLFGEGEEFFSCGAYPLEEIRDPTGAGDTFVGGFAGYLASLPGNDEITFAQLKQAVVHGSVMASFNVEAFSLERLRTLDAAQIAERYKSFQAMTDFTSAL